MENKSFKDWLLQTLEDEETITVSELQEVQDVDDLIQKTDLESFDVDSYWDNFVDYCSYHGYNPVNDFM